MRFLLQRGDTKSGKRDFEGAYEDYMIVFAFDSTDVFVLNNLGAMANELGKADDAIGYLQRIIDLDPEFSISYINMGYQYQLMERHEKALEYFNKAVELDPENPLALSNRSFSLLNTGQLKAAMKDIEKSLKIYPNNSYAYRNRAHIYLKQGKKDKACEDLITANNLGFTKMYGPEVRRLMITNCYNYKPR
ncbi:MAG: tetratricopeptide repeat protein [Bacteroidota bacterium]